jgi:hypothetical protein
MQGKCYALSVAHLRGELLGRPVMIDGREFGRIAVNDVLP